MKKICKKQMLIKITSIIIIQYYVKDRWNFKLFISKKQNISIEIRNNINNRYRNIYFNVNNRGDEKLDFKEFKKDNMINIIYRVQDERIDEILKKTDERLKDRLKKINFEKIEKNSNCIKELRETFNKIEDNYNMKITEYNKEMYKQGFMDGVNLILNCLID